jgi:orotate phosphoribosyltransferase
MIKELTSSPIRDHVAQILLELKAVSFNVEELFNYVSGIQSPVYIDNRKVISYPDERKTIVGYFVDVVREEIGQSSFDVVAGTATAAIPWAAWVADRLNVPFIYVRPLSKDRGLKKQIEGVLEPGQRVLIIDDLITTGLSSSNVAQVIRAEGGTAEFCVSIFSFGAPAAVTRFQTHRLRALSLTNLFSLLKVAKDRGYLDGSKIEVVERWAETSLASLS